MLALYTTLISAHGMPDNPLFISIMVTVEPTLYVTHISKGKSKKEKRENEILSFIEKNLKSLKINVAKGEGETLNTLATFYKLDDVKAWKEYLQKHYQQMFFLNKPKDAFGVYSYIEDISRRYFF